MIFDRKYYDEFKIEQAEIDAEIAAEETTMSTEERAARNLRMDTRFYQLLDRIEQHRAKGPSTPSPDGLQRFWQHILCADGLAKSLCLNLHAFTNEGIGTIHLIGNQFLISSSWENGQKSALCKLIEASEDLWIDIVNLNDEKVICLELKFDLS